MIILLVLNSIIIFTSMFCIFSIIYIKTHSKLFKKLIDENTKQMFNGYIKDIEAHMLNAFNSIFLIALVEVLSFVLKQDYPNFVFWIQTIIYSIILIMKLYMFNKHFKALLSITFTCVGCLFKIDN